MIDLTELPENAEKIPNTLCFSSKMFTKIIAYKTTIIWQDIFISPVIIRSRWSVTGEYIYIRNQVYRIEKNICRQNQP